MRGRRHPPEWRSDHGHLPEHVVSAMRSELPGMASQTVTAIQHEVEEYADPFSGEMGRTIESAVALALGGFLSLVSGDEGDRDGYERVWDAAYSLGRGEARGGRPMDALLRAYRIGARVSWRDMSAAGVRAGLDAETVAGFAELVFSYIDELSAASAAGHADELAVAGRARQRLLEQLADALVGGRPPATVAGLAERAGWTMPDAVTAVLVPESRADSVRGHLPAGTLRTSGGAQHQQLEGLPPLGTLLVPGGAQARNVVLASLRAEAVVGPTVPPADAPRSAERAARVLRLREHGRIGDPDSSLWGLIDADDHLVALLLTADEQVVADLRAQVLAPLADLRTATAEKLTETLRAWLLHQGRREDVAKALFVHPQTVRYRMGRLRELYDERLEDPEWVLRATVALGLAGAVPAAT